MIELFSDSRKKIWIFIGNRLKTNNPNIKKWHYEMHANVQANNPPYGKKETQEILL